MKFFSLTILGRSSAIIGLFILTVILACSRQNTISKVNENSESVLNRGGEDAQKSMDVVEDAADSIEEKNEELTGGEVVAPETAEESLQEEEPAAQEVELAIVSAMELCDDKEGFTWSVEQEICFQDYQTIDSQAACEANENNSWNAESLQCFPNYELLTSQAHCESNSENVWNPDTGLCYPRYDLVTSKEECESLSGLRWVPSANDSQGACLEDLGIVCPVNYEFDGTTCVYQLGLTATSPANSCQAIKVFNPDSPDGAYWLQGTAAASFQAYCDMTSDGGGWTLIARLSNADGVLALSSEFWYDRMQEAGNPTLRNENLDSFSSASWAVAGNNLKISRSDNVDDKHLLMTENNFISNSSFQDFFNREFGSFKGADQSWANDTSRMSVPALFGNNFAATDGFQNYDCVGNIGQANALNFLSNWQTGDASVIMIGGGGDACGRADHGIAITESNTAMWNDNASDRCDFGFDRVACSAAYSLNFFIK